MRVPALFQTCSSKAEKFSVENQCCSSCSSCSSRFTRTGATKRKSLIHTYLRARTYQIVWNIWNSWNTVVFIGYLISVIWNSAGTELEHDDD